MRVNVHARRIAAALSSVTAVLLVALTGAASAASTRIVAPGSNRKVDPCTTSTPCNFVWALNNSLNGDVVQFESGEYDDSPGANTILNVFTGVTAEPVPGAATRPLIKQTTGFTGCNCPTMNVEGTVDGLEIDQAAGALGKAAGAVDLAGTIEHSQLEGKFDGMYATGSGHLIDSSVVGRGGYGLWDTNTGTTVDLDNVTVISQATTASGRDIGIYVTAAVGGTSTVNATNVYVRAAGEDVFSAGGAGNTDVTLHYSDATTELAHSTGAGTATLTDTDHPMRGDAVFASSTDYTEAPGSPTIDAGTPDPASGALDLLGSPRTIGPATDIGATEWQGAPPAVTTGAATTPAATTVTVGGTVDAGDLPTTWHVEYGPTTTYGSQSSSATVGAITGPQAVTSSLTGLTPNTTYHYRLVATNSLGPANGTDATFTTAVAHDTTPPAITHLSLSHRSFVVAKRSTAVSARKTRKKHHKPAKGTAIRFTLSEQAAVTFTISRKPSGHRKGKRVGTLTRRSEPAGADSVAFTGRIGKRVLKPGKYTVVIAATDPSGNASSSHTLKFTIVKV